MILIIFFNQSRLFHCQDHHTIEIDVTLTQNFKGSLKTRYIKSVHFKEKLKCSICDYQATQKYGLSEHVVNVHQKSESTICTEFNKSIQSKKISQNTYEIVSLKRADSIYVQNLCISNHTSKCCKVTC